MQSKSNNETEMLTLFYFIFYNYFHVTSLSQGASPLCPGVIFVVFNILWKLIARLCKSREKAPNRQHWSAQ